MLHPLEIIRQNLFEFNVAFHDGVWILEQQRMTEERTERTFSIGGVPKTIEVPVWAHDQLGQGILQDLVEALPERDPLPDWLIEANNKPRPEPVVSQIMVTPPVQAQVPCPNCRGAGVFKDQACFCTGLHGHPVPDCTICHGDGKSDNQCPVCQGLGQQLAAIKIELTREGYGTQVAELDLSKPFAITQHATADLHEPEQTRYTYHWDPARAFGAQLAELGIGNIKDIVIKTRHGWQEVFWLLGSKSIFNRDRIDLARLDPVELGIRAQTTLAGAFSWQERELEPGQLLNLEVAPLQGIDPLLQLLQQAVGPKGAFELRVHEGNIATGESGWQVFVRKAGWKHQHELGLSYELESALRNAIEGIEQAQHKEDQAPEA